MLRYRRMCLTLVGCFLAQPIAWADTVVLKNGRELDGVVASKDSATVVLDIGHGAVTLQQAEIERIDRSQKGPASPKEMELRKFASGRLVPPEARSLNELFQEAASLREQALEALANLPQVENALQQDQADLQYWQGLKDRTDAQPQGKAP